MSSMEVDSSTQLTSLQGHIRSISDLHDQLRSLRQIPSSLFQSPSGISYPVSHLFQQLKLFGDALYSDESQSALSSARDSEKADEANLNIARRRQNRKRTRPPSPESPKPYVSFQQTSSAFPNASGDPLVLEGLPDYIRQFNKSHQSKLHIWTRTRTGPPASTSHPLIVRFTVPDALVAFITLCHGPNLPPLIIETVTVFGPRETKPPHSQSEYAVYRDLSQEVAKVLQAHPHLSFQTLVDLLCSYEGVFVDRCTTCQRVLSMEGHVPPVARVWTDEGERGWSPRHTTCLRA